MLRQEPFSSTITRLRSVEPAEDSLAFRLADCRVRVASNSVRLLETLRRFYGPLVDASTAAEVTILAIEAIPPELDCHFVRVVPETDFRFIRDEYAVFPHHRVVRKRATGMIFVFGRDDHVAVGPCEANPDQVIDFVNNEVRRWRLARGALLLRATGVRRGDVALGLAGPSETGTLALGLELVQRGFAPMCDDGLLLARNSSGHRAYGVPELTIGRMEPVRAFSPSARLGCLVVLNWTRRAEPTRIARVDLEKRPDLLRALRRDDWLFGETGFADRPLMMPEPDLSSRLADVPVHEITGGLDFESAAELCAALVTACG
jgi:hypothetical protein